jgi:hypothetical protein
VDIEMILRSDLVEALSIGVTDICPDKVIEGPDPLMIHCAGFHAWVLLK